jgi:hypothetical protein
MARIAATKDPGADGLRERVLRQPTPDGQKCTEDRGDETVLKAPRIRAHPDGLRVSQDRECERIVMDARLVQQLMGSAPYRNALCRSTRSTLNHAVAP